MEKQLQSLAAGQPLPYCGTNPTIASPHPISQEATQSPSCVSADSWLPAPGPDACQIKGTFGFKEKVRG